MSWQQDFDYNMDPQQQQQQSGYPAQHQQMSYESNLYDPNAMQFAQFDYTQQQAVYSPAAQGAVPGAADSYGYGYSGGAAGMYAGGMTATQAPPQQPQQTFFTPADPNAMNEKFGRQAGSNNFEDEPPLLEELGINFDHIVQKTLIVLNPMKTAHLDAVQDTDLAGPLVFCLAFGGTLLLAGKLQFGYIYGLGLMGCLAMYALLNLMSATAVGVVCIMSILGYCLLPMCLLSTIAILLSLKGITGILLTAAAVVWCSASASKLFVLALNMTSQRLLVAYPCSLVYCMFALLTIF